MSDSDNFWTVVAGADRLLGRDIVRRLTDGGRRVIGIRESSAGLEDVPCEGDLYVDVFADLIAGEFSFPNVGDIECLIICLISRGADERSVTDNIEKIRTLALVLNHFSIPRCILVSCQTVEAGVSTATAKNFSVCESILRAETDVDLHVVRPTWQYQDADDGLTGHLRNGTFRLRSSARVNPVSSMAIADAVFQVANDTNAPRVLRVGGSRSVTVDEAVSDRALGREGRFVVRLPNLLGRMIGAWRGNLIDLVASYDCVTRNFEAGRQEASQDYFVHDEEL